LQKFLQTLATFLFYFIAALISFYFTSVDGYGLSHAVPQYLADMDNYVLLAAGHHQLHSAAR